MSSLMLVFFVFTAGGVYFVKGDSPPYNPDIELCGNVDQCTDLDGFCCEGLSGGCCVNGQCTTSTACKVGGERCGRERCSTSESCLRSQPCVCCPNCFVPIIPTCKPKCGVRACYRNEVCLRVSNARLNISTCVKFRNVNPTFGLPVDKPVLIN